jgi:uncharacterized membrane-anchored protein YitT (DUF2179 family)
MTNRIKVSAVFDYLLIALGTLLMSFGLVFFLEPNTIAPGGATGFAILIQRLFGVPIDITNLVVNIPLFIIGVIVLGKRFGIKTAYGTFALSFFIRIILVLLKGKIIIIDDMLLAAIYGGVIMGIGIGLVFKAGGTTGGTDLAGAIINKYIPSLSTAKWMMIIDLLVVFFAGIIDKSIETFLYSVIALYILVKIADFIVEGLNYAKAFMIISNNSEEIGEKMLTSLERGVTVLKGKGLYTGADREVLLCIVDRSQVIKLKDIVYSIDENAFVIVTTVHEVLGEGFKKN